jgi:hypothetical protein
MRWVRAAAWVVIVVVGSIAAAGLVLVIDHPPTDSARPEITARDAAILAPRLVAMEVPLDRIALAAQVLAGAGREALVALRALEPAAVTTAIASGDRALEELGAALAAARALAPGLREGLAMPHLPTVDRARLVAIDLALTAGGELTDTWGSVVGTTAAPMRFITLLERHDAAVARATDMGRREAYRDALDALEAASGTLAEVTAVRDAAAAAGSDVTPLDDWLAALREHDATLTSLYATLQAAGSVSTPAVERALDAERASRAALPAARGAKAAAVTALGAGEILPALLAMEDARGAIEAALRDEDEAAPDDGVGSEAAPPSAQE